MQANRWMVQPGEKSFKLRKRSTSDTEGIKDKVEAKTRLEKGIKRLCELQEVLYADNRYGILLIFQALDAAGKDGTIKHVMSGVNPQGCQVHSFKAPSHEELDHDYLWRAMWRMPEKGRIGIFNRSYYEEVVVVRVHPELLQAQKLPPSGLDDIWEHRFQDINAMERYLERNGIIPIKFYLHLSREEQQRRFVKRLECPEKNWKFSDADFKESNLYDKYIEVFEEMLHATSTKQAPWYVIPADHKWYTRVAVSEIIVSRLAELDLKFPEVSGDKRKALDHIREQLEKDLHDREGK